MKKISEDAEQNKTPILMVLKRLLPEKIRVLEIGSGTGQHAVFFAGALPHLQWQTSDLEECHPSILEWIEESRVENVLPPIMLDVAKDWPGKKYGAVYSSNTSHIVSWDKVKSMFMGVGDVLETGGLFILYGPFNFGGEFTSESNRDFDAWLREQNPERGLRNFEDLDLLAQESGMIFTEEIVMPVNNRILVWRRNQEP